MPSIHRVLLLATPRGGGGLDARAANTSVSTLYGGLSSRSGVVGDEARANAYWGSGGRQRDPGCSSDRCRAEVGAAHLRLRPITPRHAVLGGGSKSAADGVPRPPAVPRPGGAARAPRWPARPWTWRKAQRLAACRLRGAHRRHAGRRRRRRLGARVVRPARRAPFCRVDDTREEARRRDGGGARGAHHRGQRARGWRPHRRAGLLLRRAARARLRARRSRTVAAASFHGILDGSLLAPGVCECAPPCCCATATPTRSCRRRACRRAPRNSATPARAGRCCSSAACATGSPTRRRRSTRRSRSATTRRRRRRRGPPRWRCWGGILKLLADPSARGVAPVFAAHAKIEARNPTAREWRYRLKQGLPQRRPRRQQYPQTAAQMLVQPCSRPPHN